MKKLALIFAVTALLFAGYGCEDSSTENAVVKLESPKITLGEKTQTSIAFSWTPVENASGYEFAISSNDQTVASKTLPASQSNHSVDGLSPNTSYKLTLRAIGGDMFENSDWAQVTFSTSSDDPQPTAVEIKDAVLKNYLFEKGIDSDSDGVISFEEAAAFKTIEMGFEYAEDATDENTVKDLSGLEYFSSLETLNLKFHRVTDAAPIEALSSLTSLNLGENPISALDLSKLGNLTDLRLYGTQIKELDLTAVPKLQVLYLQRTALTEVDLSGLAELTNAFINEAQLTSLKADGLSKLTRLDAVKNKLAQVTVSNCEALTELHLNDNQLAQVTLTGLPKLMRLNLYANNLSAIDLSKMNSLLWVFLFDNQISELDLTANTALREVYVSNNPIQTLDLSLNPDIEIVEAQQMSALETINLKNGYCSDWAEYYIEQDNNALKTVFVDPGYEFEYVSKLFKNRPDVIVTTGEGSDPEPPVTDTPFQATVDKIEDGKVYYSVTPQDNETYYHVGYALKSEIDEQGDEAVLANLLSHDLNRLMLVYDYSFSSLCILDYIRQGACSGDECYLDPDTPFEPGDYYLCVFGVKEGDGRCESTTGLTKVPFTIGGTLEFVSLTYTIEDGSLYGYNDSMIVTYDFRMSSACAYCKYAEGFSVGTFSSFTTTTLLEYFNNPTNQYDESTGMGWSKVNWGNPTAMSIYPNSVKGQSMEVLFLGYDTMDLPDKPSYATIEFPTTVPAGKAVTRTAKIRRGAF